MKFILELWPDQEDSDGNKLPPEKLVQQAIDSVRDHGESLSWDIEHDDGTAARNILIEP